MHKWATDIKPLVEQFVSVAGDESRTDIDYTDLEFPLRVSWRNKLSLKLTPKVFIDWVDGERSGGVLELELGWNITRRWRLESILGRGLWGTGVPGTYSKKFEMTLRFNF